jgi:ABC-type cobalamin transport system ATPase subunit
MVAQGLSIIFISHKLAEVLRVSHRIAVLRGGKLVARPRAKAPPRRSWRSGWWAMPWKRRSADPPRPWAMRCVS